MAEPSHFLIRTDSILWSPRQTNLPVGCFCQAFVTVIRKVTNAGTGQALCRESHSFKTHLSCESVTYFTKSEWWWLYTMEPSRATSLMHIAVGLTGVCTSSKALARLPIGGFQLHTSDAAPFPSTHRHSFHPCLSACLILICNARPPPPPPCSLLMNS